MGFVYKKLIPLLSLAFSLTGCLIVGDFGDGWDLGTVDPALEGKWVKHMGSWSSEAPMDSMHNPDYQATIGQPSYIFSNAGDHYNVLDNSQPASAKVSVAKTLELPAPTVAPCKFLMIKPADEEFEQRLPKGGYLIPYEFFEGKFVIAKYTPENLDQIEQIMGDMLIKEDGDSPPYVSKLNVEALKALVRVCSVVWPGELYERQKP
jgi:hypothetical protein